MERPPRNFSHRLTHPMPARAAAISEASWFFREHILGMLRKAPALPPPAPTELPREGVTWVGHASFVLQMSGTTLLLDPVWSLRLPGGIRRLQAPGVPWEQLPPVDGVLLSHNHFDHLDLPTLRRLPEGTPILAPAGLAGWLRKQGLPHAREFDWWEGGAVGNLHAELVPAHHWSRRGFLDTNRSLWGGWVVSDGRRKVYFGGDTAYGMFFRQIGHRHPDIDTALLPIGAYAPRQANGSAHMDPEEAVAAFQDCRARTMVPMHWGAFRLSPEPVLEPIERCRAAWKAAGLESHRLAELAPGQSLAFAARGKPAHLPRPPRPAPASRVRAKA
ncbi:MAG: hypothetical protein QOG31_1512 [Thermoplasmata archaeon]|jgi:L-ascorbate metabolism protein UlaG (beta-lactamase superfamily)|nr:hypothetical protein [Thermoplasmata archaeon]